MQKWEYLTAKIREYGVSRVNDKEVPHNIKDSKVIPEDPLHFLQRAGAEGWELVSVVGDSLAYCILIFKRPLAEQSKTE